MLLGFHHVTAIAGDPQRNVEFYRDFMGMKLAKRTVNFDDPGTHHFYFGDASGSIGTLLTFFPWAGSERKARKGSGQITAVALGVRSLREWQEKAQAAGIAVSGPMVRNAFEMLSLQDPDGLILQLVAVGESAGRLHEITITESEAGVTGKLLTTHLQFEQTGEQDFAIGTARVHVVHDPAAERGLAAPGGVHHVALGVSSSEELHVWRARLLEAGFKVTLVQDRVYFQSIYFRQPRGVLFEIATLSPGFHVDEEILGSRLCLPPWLEPSRTSIEERLAPVRI